MLVPDVDGTGLPLTELLPYTKSKTRQIKQKYNKINDTMCLKDRTHTRTRGEDEKEEKERGGEMQGERAGER